MKTEEKIIMYASPESAELKTVTGWVSSTGRFWGKDEHMARWEGCTHTLCECGKMMPIRSYTICEDCRAKKWRETYNSYKFEVWDFKEVVYDHISDKYFFDVDQLEEYLEEEEINPQDLQLVICEPNNLYALNYDYWNDCLTDDQDLPKELEELIKKVNEFCKGHGPISWSPGKIRTEYRPITVQK